MPTHPRDILTDCFLHSAHQWFISIVLISLLEKKILGLEHMLSTEHDRKTSKKHRLLRHALHRHGHIKDRSVELVENLPQSSKIWTPEEIEQRRLIEQYIFSKLEIYAHKPRLWQITHSSHIKRRLLSKSSYISTHYSISPDFYHECINQLFLRIDKYVLHARQLINSTSGFLAESNHFLQKPKEKDNQWRSLQLQRARSIFSDLNLDEFTDDELLQKYSTHIIQTITPKPDLNSTDCIAQLREQPFDLNDAYEQSQTTGKGYLEDLLQNYHQQTIPDLQTIEEMVNLSKMN